MEDKIKKERKYNYPVLPSVSKITGMAEMPLEWEYLLEYARMKYEQGADRDAIQECVAQVMQSVRDASARILRLPEKPEQKAFEPDELEKIRESRPCQRTAIKNCFDEALYRKKIAGAVYGRFAGCTLGAPVEFWGVDEMREWAEYCGQAFPPEEYWNKTKRPNELRYEVSRFEEYENAKLNKVPVDDDVTYTILGWLILEDSGLNFTTGQAGEAWKKYLPRACTAEEVVLNHLRNGEDAEKAAEINNPYSQWIGADIRADAWGYVSPGMPEKAAEMAYRDAYLTHRRNGIYGEMYFSAVIAAAFAAKEGTDGAPKSMEKVLRIGLEQIPEHSHLAGDIQWALEQASVITDYKKARQAAEEYFGGMSGVHTNFNACLTIWGLLLGGNDFTKVIGQITAMGYDNDCNAATAGSIFGAFYGIDAIPEKWYKCFNNKVCTYLNGYPQLNINQICERFLYFAKLNVSATDKPGNT